LTKISGGYIIKKGDGTVEGTGGKAKSFGKETERAGMPGR